MNDSVGKCLKCGVALSESGCCKVCGSDQGIVTATNISAFIDKVKQLVNLPGLARTKLALGALALLEKRSMQAHCLSSPVIKIGRDADNDIVLDADQSVSRNHACITFLKDGYWFEDLGSTNGSFVNKKRIHGRRLLGVGDHLLVGKTEMVVTLANIGKQNFPDYELLEEVGRGGMGIVYKALDRKHNRTVALKRLLLHNIEPARQRARSERFKREAKLSKLLIHPNIVPIYDVQLGPESFYYAMEFLNGHNLRAEFELSGGRLSPEQYMPVLAQVASALTFAHKQQVVHRDVKPDNIFILPDGRVKLTDFGIARVMADLEEIELTRSGAMLGTLAYASPEQLSDARHVDHRADIFSLGVVTYEALSGISPFEGNGITDTVVQVASSQEEPLCKLVPQVNQAISAVVSKAMSKQAAQRYQSASEFADHFRQALDSACCPL